MKNLLVFVFLGLSWVSLGLTVSNSGEEVTYRYHASFRSLERVASLAKPQAKLVADFHAAHLFGLFHSPEVVGASGYDSELVEGFAGTKYPQVGQVETFSVDGDPYLWIRYNGHGTMMVHKWVLKKWLGDKHEGVVELPLLVDLPSIYTDNGQDYRTVKWKKCTDTHYHQASDFSYFYTPYRCTELKDQPLAALSGFTLERIQQGGQGDKATVPLKRVHGTNGNGRITSFYFANGFNATPPAGSTEQKIHRDAGWKSFAFLERLFVRNLGFESIESLSQLRELLGEDFGEIEILSPVHMDHDTQRRYFRTYVKRTDSEVFVVRSALFHVPTEVGPRPQRSFATFWKEAWENGDVIYYGGHSGDGGTLSLETILHALDASDLESIRFQPDKMQIAVFDSCSSYAHYQDLYMAKKPANLELVTFGLVSLYEYATATVNSLTKTLMQSQSLVKWKDALEEIERAQLDSHVNSRYPADQREAKLKYFLGKGFYPSSLMNVRIPN